MRCLAEIVLLFRIILDAGEQGDRGMRQAQPVRLDRKASAFPAPEWTDIGFPRASS
jgi:hypothetical protein